METAAEAAAPLLGFVYRSSTRMLAGNGALDMECEPHPVGELAEAFAGFADQLLDRLRRLEARVLALEVVIATMVRDEVTGPELRRTVMQRLGTEIRQSIIANSTSLEAASALIGTVLKLLPEDEAERNRAIRAGG